MKSDDPKRSTTNGITPGYEDDTAPSPIGSDGQHTSYWILSAEERAKGLVRPVRRSYVHVGPPAPTHPLRDLTSEEHARYEDYVAFEAYPADPASSATGRFWTQAQIDAVGKGCGTVTTMGRSIAESYARDPGFYTATFCVRCGGHFPVGPDGEFFWVDAPEKVGT